MAKTTVLHNLRSNEKTCTLSEALESSYMKDPLYVWLVYGQYIQEQSACNLYNATTYVAKSFTSNTLYTVCTIIDGKKIPIQKDFSKKELQQFFPKLFSLTGQLISLR